VGIQVRGRNRIIPPHEKKKKKERARGIASGRYGAKKKKTGPRSKEPKGYYGFRQGQVEFSTRGTDKKIGKTHGQTRGACQMTENRGKF